MTFETWRGTVGDFSDGANYTFSTALLEVGTDYWYSFNGTDGRGWAIGVPTVPVDAPDVVLEPVTALVVGNPQYTGAVLYVTSSTSLSLSATDRSGLGIRRTMYRTDENPWVAFSATGPFRLTGESNHALEWFSEDGAGNGEPHRFANLTVDDTPPVTTISQSTPLPRPGTRFTLAATDSRSGVNYTEYRIDDGPWTTYGTPLSVPDGGHTIRYRSIDNLGNAEGERTLVITAQIMLPVEFNWKPLVALAFIVILLAAGAWSSYRVSRNGGDGRRTVLRAFAAIALPFVVLEAATGVVSLATGFLSIPPLLGIGTAIDSSIVVAGLAVAIHRGVKARPRVARPQGG